MPVLPPLNPAANARRLANVKSALVLLANAPLACAPSASVKQFSTVLFIQHRIVLATQKFSIIYV